VFVPNTINYKKSAWDINLIVVEVLVYPHTK